MAFRSRTVLILGAGGIIGRQLLELLAEALRLLVLLPSCSSNQLTGLLNSYGGAERRISRTSDRRSVDGRFVSGLHELLVRPHGSTNLAVDRVGTA